MFPIEVLKCLDILPGYSFHVISSVNSVVSNTLGPHEQQHVMSPYHHKLPEFTQTHVH